MQPTDLRVRSVFVFLTDTEAARRIERGTGQAVQGLVGDGNRGGSTNEGSPHATPGRPQRSGCFGTSWRRLTEGLLISAAPQYSSHVPRSGRIGLESVKSETEVACRDA